MDMKPSMRMAKEVPKPGRILIPLGGIIHSCMSPWRPEALPLPAGVLVIPCCVRPPPLVRILLAINKNLSLHISLLHLSVTIPSFISVFPRVLW